MNQFTETQSYSLAIKIIPPCVVLALGLLAWPRIDASARIIRLAIKGFLVVIFIIILSFTCTKMDTRIDESGIYYQLFPGQWSEKKIQWTDINSITVRNYVDFMKSRRADIDIYSVADKYGIYIYLANGNTVIIGTQKPDEVSAILANIPQSHLKNVTHWQK